MDTCHEVPQNDDRMQAILQQFMNEFNGKRPTAIIRVPGRVNIIGEHIDYCGYGVLPMAIEPSILVAVAATSSEDKCLQLVNTNGEKYQRFSTELVNGNVEIDASKPYWWNYFLCGVKGIAGELKDFQWPCGMLCLVDGTIPPASGLSSSSAVVVSGALATLRAMDKWDLFNRFQIADICAKSERFIGTQGGGMDQAIELLAEQNCAKLIEFNPLTTTDVKLPNGASFVVINSLVEANKAAGSEFNQRVAECRLATKVLGKKLNLVDWHQYAKLKEVQIHGQKSLKEMIGIVDQVLHMEPYSINELVEILEMSREDIMDNILTPNTKHLETFKLYQRAHHVYSEAARVYDFKEACMAHESLEHLGSLMFKSHESCSQFYECSHEQLDKLVELAKTNGAYGARLTGAGWGGCIVALISEANVGSFVQAMKKDYFTNVQNCDSYIFPTVPGAGAKIYKTITK